MRGREREEPLPGGTEPAGRDPVSVARCLAGSHLSGTACGGEEGIIIR